MGGEWDPSAAPATAAAASARFQCRTALADTVAGFVHWHAGTTFTTTRTPRPPLRSLPSAEGARPPASMSSTRRWRRRHCARTPPHWSVSLPACCPVALLQRVATVWPPLASAGMHCRAATNAACLLARRAAVLLSLWVACPRPALLLLPRRFKRRRAQGAATHHGSLPPEGHRWMRLQPLQPDSQARPASVVHPRTCRRRPMLLLPP